MGGKAFYRESDQVAALSGEGLQLYAPVEVILCVNFLVRVEQLEPLSVKRVKLDLGIIDCVLKRDRIALLSRG